MIPGVEIGVSYELRTARGTRVFAYDSETRARDARRLEEKRRGVRLWLYRIRTVEEAMDEVAA